MTNYLDFFNEYIIGIIQMLTGFHFFSKFLKKKMKLIHYLLFGIFGILILVVIQTNNIAEFFLYILLLIAGGFIICKADKVTIVLYAIVTAEIMQLCYGIFNSILSILYPFMTFFHQKMVGFTFMVLGNMALLVAVCCYHMIQKYLSYDKTIKSKYVLMILTPIVMIFLMGDYVNYIIYGDTIHIDRRGNIANANHYWMLMIQLFGMASLFCIMFAYKKLLENLRFSTELLWMEKEEHFLMQYVEEAKVHYEKTKSFRHDIKNHITVIRKLLQSGKSEQVLDYVLDMEEKTKELSFPCNTNNPVVDILIGNKLGIAKGMHIDVYCSLMLPYPCSVRDIDFCIILSNALDNAIYACKNTDNNEKKYIRVMGRIQGDFILIEIENSFYGSETFKIGTGLSNVKTVAEKYHGAMSIKVQDAAFLVSVLLIIPQHSESISQQNN